MIGIDSVWNVTALTSVFSSEGDIERAIVFRERDRAIEIEIEDQT
jgi:hypothetical protein